MYTTLSYCLMVVYPLVDCYRAVYMVLLKLSHAYWM